MISSNNSLEFSMKKETPFDFLSFVDHIFNNSVDFQKDFLALSSQIKAGKGLNKEIPSRKEIKERFNSFMYQRLVYFLFLKSFQIPFIFGFLLILFEKSQFL